MRKNYKAHTVCSSAGASLLNPYFCRHICLKTNGSGSRIAFALLGAPSVSNLDGSFLLAQKKQFALLNPTFYAIF